MLTAKNKAWKRTHLNEEHGSKDGGGSVVAVPNLHPMSVQIATTVEPPSQGTTIEPTMKLLSKRVVQYNWALECSCSCSCGTVVRVL